MTDRFDDPDVNRILTRFIDEDDPVVRRSEFLVLIRQMALMTDRIDELERQRGQKPANETTRAYELFAQGMDNQQVAKLLGVDKRNISVYRGRYKEKLAREGSPSDSEP
jgi:hypothetical protein